VLCYANCSLPPEKLFQREGEQCEPPAFPNWNDALLVC